MKNTTTNTNANIDVLVQTLQALQAKDIKAAKTSAMLETLTIDELTNSKGNYSVNYSIVHEIASYAAGNVKASSFEPQNIVRVVRNSGLVFTLKEKKGTVFLYNPNLGIFQEMRTKAFVISYVIPALKFGVLISDSEVKLAPTRKAVEDLSFFIDEDFTMEKSANDVNNDGTHVVCANGLINLKTARLEPFSPNVIFDEKVNINFYPRKKSQKLEEFLEIFGNNENVDFVQKLAGLGLTKEQNDFLTILFGTGGNGKSTFFDILRASGIQQKDGNGSFFDSNAKNENKTFISGRTALIEEMPLGTLCEQSVKVSIGSNKVISRKLYEDEKLLDAAATIIATTNTLPELDNASFGLQRRLLVLPMAQTFYKQNANNANSEKYSPLKSNFSSLTKDTDFMEAFFVWRVKGAAIALAEIEKAGEILKPEAAIAFTSQWLKEEKAEDSIESFINENIVIHDGEGETPVVFLSHLFKLYETHALSLGEKPKKLKELKRAVSILEGAEVTNRAPNKKNKVYGSGSAKAQKVYGISIAEEFKGEEDKEQEKKENRIGYYQARNELINSKTTKLEKEKIDKKEQERLRIEANELFSEFGFH